MQVNIVRVRFDYSCEYHEYGVRSFFSRFVYLPKINHSW